MRENNLVAVANSVAAAKNGATIVHWMTVHGRGCTPLVPRPTKWTRSCGESVGRC